MEELLLNEVYYTIVAAQDIIVDAIVLEDGLVPEPDADADADDMDWSETEHTDPSPAPTLTLSPSPTPTRTLSKNLTCAVCTKKMPRGKDARLHLLLCAFYAETGQRRRPNRPQQQQRPRRLCTPADYDEKKMRQPAPSKSEFIVAGILAHSSANEFLVRWADRGMAASWEPMSNLIDRDASGKNVQVNALLLEYAKTHRLSCLDALLN